MNPVTEELLTPSANTQLQVFAKNQPGVDPLTARVFADGKIYSEWTPTPEEVSTLMLQLATGHPVRIRLWQWTFGCLLQPVALEVVP